MPSGKRSDRPARRIGCQIGLAQKHINTHTQTSNCVQNSGVPSQVRLYFFSVDPLLDRSIAVVVLPNLKHLAYHMSLIYYHLWFMMYHWVITCVWSNYVHLKSSIPTPKLGPSMAFQWNGMLQTSESISPCTWPLPSSLEGLQQAMQVLR